MINRGGSGARRTGGQEPEWLTLGQAAKYLGVAQSTIRKWSDMGRLPAFYTPGKHRRYRRTDLDAFLDRSGPGGRTKGGPLVLIVDDDAGLRGFVRASLELEGYTVREAASGEEGLAALEEEAPDLILLDVMMPRVDGWEMLTRMQERHGVGTIPVLMFSGKVDEGTIRDAASGGAQGFIGKPFDPQQLVETAKQMLPNLIGLDEDLRHWVVTHRVDALDVVALGLSYIGSYGAVWIALALAAAVVLRRPSVFALVVVTVPLADLVALGLKQATGRERPYLVHPEPEPLMRSSLELSFPSGHAATSFAGATLLALAVPRLAWPLLALAAAIGWSRVYVGVHWPSDVLVGALLGAALALGVRALPRLRAGRRR